MGDTDPRAGPRVGYLVAQLPAINHHYLVEEIGHLRNLGIEVSVASVSPADRPPDQLRPDERALLSETYCVKMEAKFVAVAALAGALLTHPVRFFAAFRRAYSLAKSHGRPRRYALYYLVEAVLVDRWMKNSAVDHLHASFTASIALIVNILFDRPTSFGVYGFGELYDPVGTQLGLKIDRSVFVRSVSKHGVGQMMLASPPQQWSRLRYVPLGIQPDAFPPRAVPLGGPFDVLCVGRLSPEKGHRLLLSALERLTEQGLPATVRMRFVGDGPDRVFLEADAARRGLSDLVVFEGRVSQDRLEEAYLSASAFVMASLYEGIPIVLMEAMSREIPCIAPAINGIPELILPGESGLLFSPGDEEELAALIGKLVTSSQLAKRLGEAGRERVLQHYDIGRNCRLLAELFRSLPRAS